MNKYTSFIKSVAVLVLSTMVTLSAQPSLIWEKAHSIHENYNTSGLSCEVLSTVVDGADFLVLQNLSFIEGDEKAFLSFSYFDEDGLVIRESNYDIIADSAISIYPRFTKKFSDGSILINASAFNMGEDRTFSHYLWIKLFSNGQLDWLNTYNEDDQQYRLNFRHILEIENGHFVAFGVETRTINNRTEETPKVYIYNNDGEVVYENDIQIPSEDFDLIDVYFSVYPVNGNQNEFLLVNLFRANNFDMSIPLTLTKIDRTGQVVDFNYLETIAKCQESKCNLKAEIKLTLYLHLD